MKSNGLDPLSCCLMECTALRPTQAGRSLAIDQPKVSELLRGRLTQFSTERLLRFLTALGHDIDIVGPGTAEVIESGRTTACRTPFTRSDWPSLAIGLVCHCPLQRLAAPATTLCEIASRRAYHGNRSCLSSPRRPKAAV